MRKVTKPNENSVLDTTGKRIAWHRKHLGLTQEKIAEILIIQRPHFNMIENDKRQPTIQQLTTLADTLCVTADYLLCRVNTPSTDPDIIAINNKIGLSENSIKQLAFDRHHCKKAFENKQVKKYDINYFRILKLRVLNFLINNDEILYSIAKYVHSPELCRVILEYRDKVPDIHDGNFVEETKKEHTRYSHFSSEDYANVHLAAIIGQLADYKKRLIQTDDKDDLLMLLDKFEIQGVTKNAKEEK